MGVLKSLPEAGNVRCQQVGMMDSAIGVPHDSTDEAQQGSRPL